MEEQVKIERLRAYRAVEKAVDEALKEKDAGAASKTFVRVMRRFLGGI